MTNLSTNVPNIPLAEGGWEVVERALRIFLENPEIQYRPKNDSNFEYMIIFWQCLNTYKFDIELTPYISTSIDGTLVEWQSFDGVHAKIELAPASGVLDLYITCPEGSEFYDELVELGKFALSKTH